MKGRVVVVITVLFCALLSVFLLLSNRFVTMEKSGPPEVKYLVGMSQNNLLDPWGIAMQLEIEEEAKKYEDLRVIFTDAANDLGRQAEDIERLVDYGVDLLIVSATEMDELQSTITKVHELIPVILLGQPLAKGGYTLYVGADNEQVGRMAAEMILEDIGESGNIIEIIGDDISQTGILRDRGFHEVMEEFPGVTVETRLIANWMRDQAEDRMKEYIVVHQPVVDAIFAQSDTMAEGAYIAMEKLRVSKGVPIVGIGGTSGQNGGIELVKSGTLSGTVHCPTGGHEAIQYAMSILNGETDIPLNIILEPVKIRSGNAK